MEGAPPGALSGKDASQSILFGVIHMTASFGAFAYLVHNTSLHQVALFPPVMPGNAGGLRLLPTIPGRSFLWCVPACNPSVCSICLVDPVQEEPRLASLDHGLPFPIGCALLHSSGSISSLGEAALFGIHQSHRALPNYHLKGYFRPAVAFDGNLT